MSGTAGPARTTIQEVARRSGSSPSTVSRVLTGNAVVSAARRDAVLAAIAELGYRPDMVARGLRTGTTRTLGLLIHDVLSPFFGAIAKGVEDEALELGYTMMLCNTGEEPEREMRYLRLLRDKGADGVIFAPMPHDQSELATLLGTAVPIVQIDRFLPELVTDVVALENAEAASRLVAHLIERGHRRIALITHGVEHSSLNERKAGYRQALAEAGLRARPEHVLCIGHDWTAIPPVLAPLLARPEAPSAVVATTNGLGLSTLRAIRALGLQMPDDLALATFDDTDVFALHSPSVTVVAQPAYEMGRTAVRLLARRLREPSARTETVRFPAELVVRGSTAPVDFGEEPGRARGSIEGQVGQRAAGVK